jgi:hypothetical protein
MREYNVAQNAEDDGEHQAACHSLRVHINDEEEEKKKKYKLKKNMHDVVRMCKHINHNP